MGRRLFKLRVDLKFLRGGDVCVSMSVHEKSLNAVEECSISLKWCQLMAAQWCRRAGPAGCVCNSVSDLLCDPGWLSKSLHVFPICSMGGEFLLSLSTSDLSIQKFSFNSVHLCLTKLLCNNFPCNNTLDFILVTILLRHVSEVAVRLSFETIFFWLVLSFFLHSLSEKIWQATVELPRGVPVQYRYFKGYFLEPKVCTTFSAFQLAHA